jgi:hypothetical protein
LDQLQNTYTRRFNMRHGQWGQLFGDRYKSVLVDGSAAAYYTTLWDYLHLNPCRAGLIDYTKGGSLLDYPWSSLSGGFALRREQRPGWLASEAVFRILGLEDTVRGRREMVERLDARGLAEGEDSGRPAKGEVVDRRLSDLKRGWYWGSQEFAERMLGLTKALRKPRKSRAYQRTPEVLHHGELAAREILERGLRREGLREQDLPRLRANDPRKVAVAREIWTMTSVGQGWIAEHLAMKNAANVSLALHRAARMPAQINRQHVLQEDAH